MIHASIVEVEDTGPKTAQAARMQGQIEEMMTLVITEEVWSVIAAAKLGIRPVNVELETMIMLVIVIQGILLTKEITVDMMGKEIGESMEVIWQELSVIIANSMDIDKANAIFNGVQWNLSFFLIDEKKRKNFFWREGGDG